MNIKKKINFQGLTRLTYDQEYKIKITPLKEKQKKIMSSRSNNLMLNNEIKKNKNKLSWVNI